MINTHNKISLFFLTLVFQMGCQSDSSESQNMMIIESIALDNLVAIADCTGPNLRYTTEVHSTEEGYVYFKQSYDGNENFEIVILDDSLGYQLDENHQKSEQLSAEVIAMIRGHEFHKIHLQPSTFYSDISFIKKETYQDQPCEVYAGLDEMNNKVLLYYNKGLKRLEGLKLKNPLDTTEQIEVIYKEWMTKGFGSVAKRVEILQDERDLYVFDFNEVRINDNDFIKLANM